jgi:cyanophycin synthetase
MELVEIRDLDGPNVFLLKPAIKIELKVGRRDLTRESLADLRRRLEPLGITDESTAGGVGALGDALIEVVRHVHRVNGRPEPELTWRELEEPGHVALAFSWTRRDFGRKIAQFTVDLAMGEQIDHGAQLAAITRTVSAPPSMDDAPGYLRDADRNVPILGITGTNGKTTTTRLCAHILRLSGRRVGWTSTSGVYIDGEQVLEGDYTGPQGAHRVLAEPGLDVAVIESARGGILLRGLAYESNDAGVFLNVSGDHLGLLGVRSVEVLAQVKATVVRVTRPEGYAILNADDPLVRGVAGGLRSRIFYFSQDGENPAVLNHVAAAGSALVVADGVVVLHREGKRATVVELTEVPMTFGGRAAHMVENALGAVAACLALGLTAAEVANGLRSFRNSPEHNLGRLNVFDIDGVTVIVDYAHNEAGLEQLLRLGRTFVREGGTLVAVVGSAGDRQDESVRALGKIAATFGDEVVIRGTERYLRGRASAEELTTLIADGVASGGRVPVSIEPTELAGLEVALRGRRAGDVVALMCFEQQSAVLELLASRGVLRS